MNFNMEKDKKYNIYIFILIFIFSLIPLLWFKSGTFIWGGEMTITPSVYSNFFEYLYLWSSRLYQGTIGTYGIQMFPFYFLLHILTNLGISFKIIEVIIYILIFFIFGISSYYLTSIIFGFNKHYLLRIIASIFYMINPFNLIFTWYNFYGTIFFWASLPLIIGLFIQFLRTDRKKYLILFLLIATFLAMPFAHPSQILVLWFIVLVFFIYYLLENKINKEFFLMKIKNLLILFGFWILINLWIIIPLLYSVWGIENAGSQDELGRSALDVLAHSSMNSTFLNVSRLLGGFLVGESFRGDFYYSWYKIYSSNFFIILSFLIPFLIIVSILFLKNNKKNKRKILFFFIFTILSLYLLKGIQPPMEGIFVFIFQKIPFMGAFRNHIDKLGIITVLFFSILIGYSFQQIYDYIKQYTRKLAYICMAILFIILFPLYQYPYFNGDIIFQGGEHLPSYHTKIPEYYKELNDFLSKYKDNYRVYLIPLPTIKYTIMNWGQGYGFLGFDPTSQLIDKPVVIRDFDNLPGLINNQFYKENNEDIIDISRVASLLNVRFFLIRKDVDLSKLGIDSLDRYTKVLEENERIRYVKNFDRVDLYKLDDDVFLPLIYIPENVYYIEGGFEDIENLVNSENYNYKSIFLSEDKSEKKTKE